MKAIQAVALGTSASVLAALIGLSSAQEPAAQDTTPVHSAHTPRLRTHQPPVDGSKNNRRWRDVVGMPVVVEGIAWGAREKGLGERVILDGTVVYVRGARFAERQLNGKLVRVTGTLHFKRIPAAPPYGAGYSTAIEFYEIAVEKCEELDRVEWPWMKTVDVPIEGKSGR